MMEMPPLQFAQANGVRLAFYDAGPRDDPTPFLLCHGFPEIAFTWRRQIKGLSEAGFRAIALDQRGYGASDRPPEVEAYSIDRLAGDLVGLLDHLKIDKAIIVGHDWGGYVVWETALRYPDRVAGVVSLNSPHVKRAPADPIAMLRARFGDRMYISSGSRTAASRTGFSPRMSTGSSTRCFAVRSRRAKKPAAQGQAPTRISSPSLRPTTRLKTAGRRSCPRRSGRCSSRPSDGAASPVESTGIATSPATGKTQPVATGR